MSIIIRKYLFIILTKIDVLKNIVCSRRKRLFFKQSTVKLQKFKTLPLKFSRLFQNVRDRNDDSSTKTKETIDSFPLSM